MTLRSKKAVRYYGTSRKPVSDGVSVEQVGKSVVEPVNANSIVKDVFVTLPSKSLKALAWDKEGDLRNHFVQNLDFAMSSKNFSWLSNLVLTIPAKLNGHSVIRIIDTGSSGVIVLQSCVDQLKLKEDGWIAYMLTMPNDTSSQERKIFEGVKIDMGKSSIVLPVLVLDGLHYNILLRVN